MFKKITAFLVSMFLTLSFTIRRVTTGENNPNNEITITENRFAAENQFISMEREKTKLPTFEQERDNLPKPRIDDKYARRDAYRSVTAGRFFSASLFCRIYQMCLSQR